MGKPKAVRFHGEERSSSLPAFATSSQAPSPLRTTEFWEARCALPVPRPPVSKLPSGSSRPSSERSKAMTSFRSASFVCT
jgi:hypothetical protein